MITIFSIIVFLLIVSMTTKLIIGVPPSNYQVSTPAMRIITVFSEEKLACVVVHTVVLN
jgi:ABC-type transport system involved in multi-copper enzyme maturation permease subunit